MELTVLGCSGSYGAPAGGACSGYLVRAGDAVIWMDCGNGSFANLQQHANPADLTAVVITQDAYGHGPVARTITAVAGSVEHGDSGGPAVDASGFVEATIFAARLDSASGFDLTPIKNSAKPREDDGERHQPRRQRPH